MEAGQLDLAAGTGAPAPRRLWRWVGVSPPAGTSPLPTLLSFFHVCGGRAMVLSPQQLPLPRNSPFSLLPYRRPRKGEGQGSPSVLRLHRVFRLNQEIFYYQKEKRKKKIPAATFPPCPIGTVETGSVGFPRRVAQGWNTLRQEWWSSPSGPPPGPLWASPLPSPLLLSLQTTRGGLPLTSGPWATAGAAGHCAALRRWGWQRGTGSGALHTAPSAPLPRSWAFPFTSCCGDFSSPPQVCAIFSHPLLGGKQS